MAVLHTPYFNSLGNCVQEHWIIQIRFCEKEQDITRPIDQLSLASAKKNTISLITNISYILPDFDKLFLVYLKAILYSQPNSKSGSVCLCYNWVSRQSKYSKKDDSEW